MRALLRGSDDVDHVVQETWLRAIGKPPAQRAREQREAVTARHVADEPSAAETVERLQACARVSQAVTSLPAGLRDAVVLRHVQGLAITDVASRIGISGETARQRVHRGLQQLRRDLAPEFARDAHPACGAHSLWAIAAWPAASESVRAVTLFEVAMSKAGTTFALAALLL